LHNIEKWILAEEGDLDGALKAIQDVAKINYKVRGSCKWLYFLEHWHITGFAIVCKKRDLAREALKKVWNNPSFQAFPKKEANLIFQDLTRAYVSRRWTHKQWLRLKLRLGH